MCSRLLTHPRNRAIKGQQDGGGVRWLMQCAANRAVLQKEASAPMYQMVCAQNRDNPTRVGMTVSVNTPQIVPLRAAAWLVTDQTVQPPLAAPAV